MGSGSSKVQLSSSPVITFNDIVKKLSLIESPELMESRLPQVKKFGENFEIQNSSNCDKYCARIPGALSFVASHLKERFDIQDRENPDNISFKYFGDQPQMLQYARIPQGFADQLTELVNMDPNGFQEALETFGKMVKFTHYCQLSLMRNEEEAFFPVYEFDGQRFGINFGPNHINQNRIEPYFDNEREKLEQLIKSSHSRFAERIESKGKEFSDHFAGYQVELDMEKGIIIPIDAVVNFIDQNREEVDRVIAKGRSIENFLACRGRDFLSAFKREYESLIKEGISLQDVEEFNHGVPTLVHAIKRNMSHDVIKYLVEDIKVDLSRQTKEGSNAFTEAVNSSSLPEIKYLYDKFLEADSLDQIFDEKVLDSVICKANKSNVFTQKKLYPQADEIAAFLIDKGFPIGEQSRKYLEFHTPYHDQELPSVCNDLFLLAANQMNKSLNSLLNQHPEIHPDDLREVAFNPNIRNQEAREILRDAYYKQVRNFLEPQEKLEQERIQKNPELSQKVEQIFTRAFDLNLALGDEKLDPISAQLMKDPVQVFQNSAAPKPLTPYVYDRDVILQCFRGKMEDPMTRIGVSAGYQLRPELQTKDKIAAYLSEQYQPVIEDLISQDCPFVAKKLLHQYRQEVCFTEESQKWCEDRLGEVSKIIRNILPSKSPEIMRGDLSRKVLASSNLSSDKAGDGR